RDGGHRDALRHHDRRRRPDRRAEDTYGATRAMLERFAVERKADVAFVDPTDLAAGERALAAKPTALLYVEAISNPLLRVTDGAYLPPHEAWLAIRGMRTLELRVSRQCAGALAVATHLAGHPKVARVLYPGLPSHPQHQLASDQFGERGGGVVTFALKDDTR